MSENKYNPDYDDNKFLNTIYVGKRRDWNGRYVELITEDKNQFFVVSEKANATLYKTRGGRQKIQATVLDAEGKIPVIYISRINVKTGEIANNGEHQICLYPEVAEKLYHFLGKVKSIDYSNPNSFKLPAESLNELHENPICSSDSYFSALRKDPRRAEIIEKLLDEGAITSKDIVNTSFRKRELGIFKMLIDNCDYWKTYASENCIVDKSEEKVWQSFFEKNEWIFGYGLDYRFQTILQQESHVSDVELNGSNTVIADYLLGDKKFTTFVEVKKPSTPLFGTIKNRSNSWRLSNDVVHSVSQILEQKASGLIKLDKQQYDSFGNPISQKAYDSRVILIIGHWKQLEESSNALECEIKKKTFELFRNDSRNIEILTYDELYDRARYIVEGDKNEIETDNTADDIPF
ncbi:MAG: Shedu immune nuclease family protein [Desulfosalsimonadaceae bacterium]